MAQASYRNCGKMQTVTFMKLPTLQKGMKMEILAAYGVQCLIFHVLSNPGKTILRMDCIWLYSEARIEEVISYEEIYLVVIQGNVVGTGSIRENEICRLFILPEYQGKGYGSRLMDLLEARIFENYPKVHVDASFPAESMYLK